MTKLTLGLQNHWWMANTTVGIVPRKSIPTHYLAESGVGIITGGNTKGKHCIYNFPKQSFSLSMTNLIDIDIKNVFVYLFNYYAIIYSIIY